jgi:hypothetical protein
MRRRQQAKKVRLMLGEQEESGHGTETHCRKSTGRAPER